jgi:hypothetical protein
MSMNQERVRAAMHVKGVLGERWYETPPKVRLLLIKAMLELIEQQQPSDDIEALLERAYAELERLGELEKRVKIAAMKLRAPA